MPQTTYTAAPATAIPGGLADDGAHDIDTAIVDEANGIGPGLVVLRTESGDRAAGFPLSIAADDDAILTPLATAAAEQVIDDEADGAIALGRIWPPAKLTVSRSAHADQDAVEAIIEYLDENGLPRSEPLAFADAGGDDFETDGYASRFVKLTIPPQAGVGGTTQIGVSAERTLDGGDVLGVTVHTHKGLLTQSLSDNEVYEDEDVMPVLKRGRINVVVENAFRAGDRVLVRLVAAGAEKLGAVRVHDTDGGDCVAWGHARLLNSGAAGAFGKLDVRLT